MIIEELKVCGEEEIENREESCLVLDTKKGISQNDEVFGWDAKRVLVGAGARALFYPTLLYNVVRNKFEPGFRWWDRVDEFILLGAVPFPTDVPRLKELGVRGVITLNEPYETLVPTSLYHVHDIDHLVIPTRDYCFAPSSNDVFQAVEFIHSNASRGQTTYVHCKAGRGRSTTIVLCYLVQYRQMTPDAAFEYVRLIRPRVLLASAQRKAVQDYYHLKVKSSHCGDQSNMIMKAPTSSSLQDLVSFDDCTAVIITDADLDGYDSHLEWAEVSLVYRVRLAGKTALAGLSCLFLCCRSGQNISGSQLSSNSCSSNTPRVQDITVDIHLLRSHKSNTKDS